MFTTYILESLKSGKYYIGYTSDLGSRLAKHNTKGSRWTKSGVPWIVVFQKDFPTKTEALRHERYLKSIKNRDQLRKILN